MEYKRHANENCPNCGDGIDVLTECLEENDTLTEQWFYDGDKCVCAAECGFESTMSVCEDIAWMEQEGNINELN